MTKRTRPAPAPARRGFTAIELTAVATIITILALILLPIVRNRVDQARMVAAEDDMRTIEIAEVLARADTGHFYRISDLDNPPVDPDDLAEAVATGAETQLDPVIGLLPAAYWNRPIPNFALNGTETSFDLRSHPLVTKWKGPYTRFSNTKFQTLEALVGISPELFRSINVGSDPFNENELAFGGTTDTTGEAVAHGDGGPILIVRNTTNTEQDDIADGEKTAIDPWGAPYLFFGASRIATNLPTNIDGNESNFGVAAVFSLGPNGLPGSPTSDEISSIDEETYYRESGFIGTGDDLVRTF